MILVNPEDRRFFNDCIVLVLLLGELVLYERAKQMIALRNSVACAGLEISNTYISISKKQKPPVPIFSMPTLPLFTIPHDTPVVGLGSPICSSFEHLTFCSHHIIGGTDAI